jgi:chromosome segregation ATPase
MSNNQYGLDNDYFERKIAILHRDGLRNWRPDELARELARMSRTADKSVMLEPEFETQVELAALREELAGANRSAETLHDVIGRLKSERDAAEQRNAELEKSVELHAQVIRDQEQMIQNHRLINEKLEIEVADLHAVIQRLNAARRPVRADVSGGSADRQDAGVAIKPTESGASEPACCNRFPKCVCHEGADGL